jgi:hypothetical protein
VTKIDCASGSGNWMMKALQLGLLAGDSLLGSGDGWGVAWRMPSCGATATPGGAGGQPQKSRAPSPFSRDLKRVMPLHSRAGGDLSSSEGGRQPRQQEVPGLGACNQRRNPHFVSYCLCGLRKVT